MRLHARVLSLSQPREESYRPVRDTSPLRTDRHFSVILQASIPVIRPATTTAHVKARHGAHSGAAANCLVIAGARPSTANLMMSVRCAVSYVPRRAPTAQ